MTKKRSCVCFTKTPNLRTASCHTPWLAPSGWRRTFQFDREAARAGSPAPRQLRSRWHTSARHSKDQPGDSGANGWPEMAGNKTPRGSDHTLLCAVDVSRNLFPPDETQGLGVTPDREPALLAAVGFPGAQGRIRTATEALSGRSSRNRNDAVVSEPHQADVVDGSNTLGRTPKDHSAGLRSTRSGNAFERRQIPRLKRIEISANFCVAALRRRRTSLLVVIPLGTVWLAKAYKRGQQCRPQWLPARAQ